VATLLEVDFRERSSLLFSKLKACPDLDVRVGRLTTGDFIVAREIVVERKPAADFASSVIDARIFRKARRLTLDGVSIMIGCRSTMLPPSYRTDIARVREELTGAAARRLSIDEGAAHDDALRRCSFYRS
jgi:hypothetical protein